MTMTDPIADMLTRIRNAIMASYNTVDIPNSRLKVDIAKVMKSEGFIRNYKIVPDEQQGILRVIFKYDESGQTVISGLKRISKPGKRVYADVGAMPRVKNNLGIAILSTSKGVITNIKAKKMNVGGEVICFVW